MEQSTEHIAGLLGELPLFRSFSSAVLRSLIAQSRLDTFAPQETIIRFGQPGQHLVIILEGLAEVVVTNERGERQQIALRRPGDFLGEISLLTGEPTTADVIALAKCDLLLIPQQAFSAFLAFNPDALVVMARTITERLRWRELDEATQTRVESAWQSLPDPYGLELSTAAPMRILTIDCFGSALRFGCFDTARTTNNLKGMVEGIGLAASRLSYENRAGKVRRELGTVDHSQALHAVAALLAEEGLVGELDAVGHKVAHGGDRYGSAVIVDEQVMQDIDECASLAPRHNPTNLAAIRESVKLWPEVPHVAVFDTGFHLTMPLHAYLYGLPYELFDRDHIRRYGSHGISHHYAALRAAAHLKRGFQELRVITCHLDDESSICAINHGRSIDTSMGFTPMEGLIMGSRCGDLDPSIILHLQKEKGLSIQEVEDLLNQQSGLLGLSGVSSDLLALEDAASDGDHRSIAAIQAYCYRIRKYIGAYTSALGGLDALVFTGRIGEGSAWVRSVACQDLSYMDILVDELSNKTIPPHLTEVSVISDEGSPIKVLVIPADQERMIARETIRTLGYRTVDRVIERQEEKEIPIEASAHHVHLCPAHIEALFGPGYDLTLHADLSQPGQYACEETVNLVGPRGRVERVRILGPARSQTQVEIAMTEEFRLGIKAPIRASGDLEGSPGVTLEGPKETVELAQGVICSVRHIHMPPQDALAFGVRDRDVCMVRVKGERTIIFGDVLVRINPDYRLAMHLDTDEANAANIRKGMVGHLVSVQDRR